MFDEIIHLDPEEDIETGDDPEVEDVKIIDDDPEGEEEIEEEDIDNPSGEDIILPEDDEDLGEDSFIEE